MKYAIDLNRLVCDTDWSEKQARPYTTGSLVLGQRGKLLTTIQVPGGEGPFPAVIFCHGMPGTERLVEFGASLRQAGFLCVHFHYSGAWGSDGSFSLDHCLEDAETILEAVTEGNLGPADPEAVFVTGHSMGGLIAAQLAAGAEAVRAAALIVPASYGYKYRLAEEDPKKEEAFRKTYDDYGLWLKGFGWQSVKEEVGRFPEAYDLEFYAAALSKKPVLAIAASMDRDVPREQNIDRLTEEIQRAGGSKLVPYTLHTDHSLSDQRTKLKYLLAEFFAAQL